MKLTPAGTTLLLHLHPPRPKYLQSLLICSLYETYNHCKYSYSLGFSWLLLCPLDCSSHFRVKESWQTQLIPLGQLRSVSHWNRRTVQPERTLAPPLITWKKLSPGEKLWDSPWAYVSAPWIPEQIGKEGITKVAFFLFVQLYPFGQQKNMLT